MGSSVSLCYYQRILETVLSGCSGEVIFVRRGFSFSDMCLHKMWGYFLRMSEAEAPYLCIFEGAADDTLVLRWIFAIKDGLRNAARITVTDEQEHDVFMNNFEFMCDESRHSVCDGPGALRAAIRMIGIFCIEIPYLPIIVF